MSQWDSPVEPWDNKQFVVETLEANERMGLALAYLYRRYPHIKGEVQQYLSTEGVEPPGIDEKVFVTYRRADGEPIFGEYSFMCSYDGLDEEESDIIEERWVLEGRKIIPQPVYDDEYDDLYEEDEAGVRKFRDSIGS